MRYCKLCVLPDSRPHLVLDDEGVCNACRTVAEKPNIDWTSRHDAFLKLVGSVKEKSTGYDCVIPVSGGKDSTWQVVKCLEHGLNPLAVTWRPPGRTAVGQRNIDNLRNIGVDHIDYSISPATERSFMLKALERFGSPAVPMHMAIFSIPLRIAVDFKIPLIVWGENSAFEYGGDATLSQGVKLDAQWFSKHGVTFGTTADDWIDSDLTKESLAPYRAPALTDWDSLPLRAVFLGWYFHWDPQETYRVAKEHGFSNETQGARTGLYDFADIDDDFISVHHYIKWYKFGFTRLFDNLSLEIRAGRLTRAEAVAEIRKRGDQTPHSDIAALCRFVGISLQQFEQIVEKFRNLDVWKNVNGRWVIPDFLIPDWKW